MSQNSLPAGIFLRGTAKKHPVRIWSSKTDPEPINQYSYSYFSYWLAISKLSFREFLNDKIIFVQLVCSFRYGREVIWSLGTSFHWKNDFINSSIIIVVLVTITTIGTFSTRRRRRWASTSGKSSPLAKSRSGNNLVKSLGLFKSSNFDTGQIIDKPVFDKTFQAISPSRFFHLRQISRPQPGCRWCVEW